MIMLMDKAKRNFRKQVLKHKLSILKSFNIRLSSHLQRKLINLPVFKSRTFVPLFLLICIFTHHFLVLQ